LHDTLNLVLFYALSMRIGILVVAVPTSTSPWFNATWTEIVNSCGRQPQFSIHGNSRFAL